MKRIVHRLYKSEIKNLDQFIFNFETSGEDYGNQDRNSLKLISINDKLINAKSFKIPNLINKIAYRFFRKSKAQRSFEYANKLKDLNIGTPQPVAYYEFKKWFSFDKSYYLSEHLDYEITYRELTHDFTIPNYEAILRAFTRFTYDLHEKQVNFLDHSPGNTLIKYNNGAYKFYLVDLNRMTFGKMPFNERIKNFSKLTIHKSMVEIMSDEYAKCINIDKDVVFNLMWKYTNVFQEKYHKKRRLKKKLKFWKAAK